MESKTLQVRADEELINQVEWIKAWQRETNKKNVGIDIKFTDADILRWAVYSLYEKLQKMAAE